MPSDKARQIKRQNEYIRDSYDRITIALPKGAKDRYQKHAASRGYKSLTAMIVDLLENDIASHPQDCSPTSDSDANE